MRKRSKSRVSLQSVIEERKENDELRVEVTLSLAGNVAKGERSGQNTKESGLVLIALATLDALSQLLPRTLSFQLDYIKEVSPQPGAPVTILSLIRLRQEGGDILLNGSCAAEEVLPETVARSILDALNRSI